MQSISLTKEDVSSLDRGVILSRTLKEGVVIIYMEEM